MARIKGRFADKLRQTACCGSIIGPDDLEALLAETIRVAVKTRAVSKRRLERISAA